jgi:hypothetical protein
MVKRIILLIMTANNISAYLSSADTNVNLGADTLLLLLNNQDVTPITTCDFTSTINISKTNLKGITLKLNAETFAGGIDYVDANKDDITVIVDPDAQSKNALSDLLNRGTLTVDRNASISSRINSVIAYKNNLKTEEVMTLDIVQHVFGDHRLISAFENENTVINNIRDTLNKSIGDKNLENVASTSSIINGNLVPIEYKWQRGVNSMVDNTMNIFEAIATIESARLYAFNQSNNYTLFLSDLLKKDDRLSFVVTYTQNQGQKTFYGNDPQSRDPSKLCITIIVTD